MKKKNLKNLSLKKRSISNLKQHELNGGTVLSVISCLLCPTMSCKCTQGDVCHVLISLAIDDFCHFE